MEFYVFTEVGVHEKFKGSSSVIIEFNKLLSSFTFLIYKFYTETQKLFYFSNELTINYSLNYND